MVEATSLEEGQAWVVLSRVKQIGGARALKLVTQCGSASAALGASAQSWEMALGRVGREARKVHLEIDWAQDQARRLQGQGGSPVDAGGQRISRSPQTDPFSAAGVIRVRHGVTESTFHSDRRYAPR